jgi:predicted MFS family arabinose efflux permease
MKYIAWIEIIVGLGLGVGPLIGSLVYPILQYRNTMYAFALVDFITMLVSCKLIPSALNETATDKEVEELQKKLQETSEPKSKRSIGWCTVLTNRHSFFAILVAFVGTTDLMFFKIFYVLELEHKYGYGESVAGYLLASTSLIYLVFCLLLPYTCANTPRKVMYLIAMFGFGLCNLMLGPTEMFGLDHHQYSFIISATSLSLMGIFSVFIFIPIIPEMLERL